MELTDFANESILFSYNDQLSGEVTCRKCGKKVGISVSTLSLFFLTASRVKVHGKWCKHSNIRSDINIILQESLNSIENKSYF